jgi:hypothetical protein
MGKKVVIMCSEGYSDKGKTVVIMCSDGYSDKGQDSSDNVQRRVQIRGARH